jgi:hypothetical protein
MKAIVIHTADEAGANNGPDYQNGWGLMNTRSAADLIAGEVVGVPKIREATLLDGEVDLYHFVTSVTEPARVSLVWTDVPGTPPPASLNPPTKMLVNDLDVVVDYIPLTMTFSPWILDPSNPGNAATTGDNNTDNVEVVDIQSAMPGLYVVAVSHKGGLDGGNPQDYSLICSHGLNMGAAPIPTLSEWGLIGLAALLVVFGAVSIIRRRRCEA